MIFSRVEPGGEYRALRMLSETGRWELGLCLFASGMRLRMGRAGRPPQVLDFCLGTNPALFLPVFDAVYRRLQPLPETSSPAEIDAVFPWVGTRPDLAIHLTALLEGSCDSSPEGGEKMKSSIQDKVEGTAKNAAGYVKEKVGRTTRDPVMMDEGMTQRAEGKAQRKIGEIKKVFGK